MLQRSTAPSLHHRGDRIADMSGNAVGVDIIETDRVRAALERFGERFLGRGDTPLEAAFFRRRGRPGATGRADRMGRAGLDVSMSHSREYAVAMVVGHAGEAEPDREGWRGKLIDI